MLSLIPHWEVWYTFRGEGSRFIYKFVTEEGSKIAENRVTYALWAVSELSSPSSSWNKFYFRVTSNQNYNNIRLLRIYSNYFERKL